MSAETLLSLRGLSRSFRVATGFLGAGKRSLLAVDDVCLDVAQGEVLGLVGESGCGKSTLGRLAVGLLRPSAGAALFEGHDLASLKGEGLRRMRRRLQIIFQDPVTSLNPRLTVGSALAEPFIIHGVCSRRQAAAKVSSLLEEVGLGPEHASRYPHQFSGGQRQRIGIARALALRPSLVLADEPVSALDVSIQAQVLNLLMDLRQKLGLTYVFVAHDLAVVRHMADRVAVMYLGGVVDVFSAQDFADPAMHPYTAALLASAPQADPARRPAAPPVLGETPSPLDPPTGCRFHPRCPEAAAICRQKRPALRPVTPRRLCACHFR